MDSAVVRDETKIQAIVAYETLWNRWWQVYGSQPRSADDPYGSQHCHESGKQRYLFNLFVNYPSLKGGAWKKRCSPHLTNQDAKRLTSRSLTN